MALEFVVRVGVEARGAGFTQLRAQTPGTGENEDLASRSPLMAWLKDWGLGVAVGEL